MYVREHACVSVYVSVHETESVCVNVCCICVRECSAYVSICVCVSVCESICICVCVCMSVCMNVSAYGTHVETRTTSAVILHLSPGLGQGPFCYFPLCALHQPADEYGVCSVSAPVPHSNLCTLPPSPGFT